MQAITWTFMGIRGGPAWTLSPWEEKLSYTGMVHPSILQTILEGRVSIDISITILGIHHPAEQIRANCDKENENCGKQGAILLSYEYE